MKEICKYCKDLGVCNNITRSALLIKHIKFFIIALFKGFFKERLFLNILVIVLCVGIYFLNCPTNIKYLLFGALVSILITSNLEKSTDNYKKNIIWDGDWTIWDWKNKNFEHKKSIYFSLFSELTNIIIMISKDLNKTYKGGTVLTSKNVKNIITIDWGYQLPINIKPDFNKLEENDAYDKFTRYIYSFSNIENVILSIQGLLLHFNEYCPNFNVKSTIPLLLQELYRTRRILADLKKFVNESSVYDDARKWNKRLQQFRDISRINTGALENNVNNLVIDLYTVYEAATKDYNFEKDSQKDKNEHQLLKNILNL